MASTSAATFLYVLVLLKHGSASADSVCSLAETDDDDLSVAMQTKVTKEIHISQEWGVLGSQAEQLGPFTKATVGWCLLDFIPKSGTYVPSFVLSLEECKALCQERDDCAAISMPWRTRLPYGYNGFTDPGNPKKDECWLHAAKYLAPHSSNQDMRCFKKDQTFDPTYRNLFSITMPKDKRMVSIDGESKNFRDWVSETILPLAATKAKKFYSCERGDSMTFYIEFADQSQGNTFLNIFAWKPCAYFSAVKESESTFAGLDNGGTKWQRELTKHAFDMGIGCGDCKLVEPVQPSTPVKVCTAEQVQAIIAGSPSPA